MYSPFTNQIIQFFQSLLPLPTILYWGTAIIILATGIALYLTSTDFRPEDILNLLPRTIVSIQKKIDKRKIGASSLIILGILGTFTFSDRLIAEAQIGSGGGQVLPTNICTNSTINTASCTIPSQVSLGTWKNFPSISSCDIQSGFPFNVTNPNCELMGNSSYRNSFASGAAGISGMIAALSVSCIKPSNTIGASLSFQYALYDQTNHKNSSNWQTSSSPIMIDNSAAWPCPGNLASITQGLNATSGTGYIFRVVGADGGGIGDNPRFSQIGITIYETLVRTFSVVYTGILGGTSVTVTAYASIPVIAASQIVNFRWFASNASTTNPSCGVNGSNQPDVCWERGTSTATITQGNFASPTIVITYPTVFTGTPTVVFQVTTAPQSIVLVTGELALLKVQTMSV